MSINSLYTRNTFLNISQEQQQNSWDSSKNGLELDNSVGENAFNFFKEGNILSYVSPRGILSEIRVNAKAWY